MSQTQEQVLKVCTQWMRSPGCPQHWVKAGGEYFDRDYAAKLDAYVHQFYGGRYSAETLSTAALAIQDQERQQAKASARAQTLVEEATAWADSKPLFAKDDFNIALLKQFFETNPTATIQDWDAYVAQNRGSIHWLEKSQPNRGTVAEKLAALGYGATSLISHRDRREQLAEQDRQRELTKSKDLKTQEKAKRECEATIASFRAGANYAESDRCRASLREVLAANKGDYLAAKIALEDWIKKYLHKSSSVH